MWRISHGPHKAPIVHRSKLAEFDQEKVLQDEIRRGFGTIFFRKGYLLDFPLGDLSLFNNFYKAAVLNTAGEHLLRHVKDIAEGNRNTLLTLPKSLIERISRYLKFTDIVNLASLSHVAHEVREILMKLVR